MKKNLKIVLGSAEVHLNNLKTTFLAVNLMPLNGYRGGTTVALRR